MDTLQCCHEDMFVFDYDMLLSSKDIVYYGKVVMTSTFISLKLIIFWTHLMTDCHMILDFQIRNCCSKCRVQLVYAVIKQKKFCTTSC